MIIEPAIRPPSEAESFLLQITTGCSANSCTFCGAYLGKPFRMKPLDEIEEDIREEARENPNVRRVFLMDGDALAIGQAKLLPVLKKIQAAFPKLTRISSYANGYNLTSRTDQDLKELADHQLKLVYMGLESGCQEVLNRCQKKATAEEMVKAVVRAEAQGIKSSVIVLLGLGGRAHSKVHVEGTITALNQMQPRYLSFLSLMLVPGTRLYQEARQGLFQELNQKELIQEAHDILAGLEMRRTIFRSNHASNYLPLEGNLPKDKETLLHELKAALSGKRRLRFEFMRGL